MPRICWRACARVVLRAVRGMRAALGREDLRGVAMTPAALLTLSGIAADPPTLFEDALDQHAGLRRPCAFTGCSWFRLDGRVVGVLRGSPGSVTDRPLRTTHTVWAVTEP